MPNNQAPQEAAIISSELLSPSSVKKLAKEVRTFFVEAENNMREVSKPMRHRMPILAAVLVTSILFPLNILHLAKQAPTAARDLAFAGYIANIVLTFSLFSIVGFSIIDTFAPSFKYKIPNIIKNAINLADKIVLSFTKFMLGGPLSFMLFSTYLLNNTYISLSKAVENVPEQITCLTEQGDMVTAHLINDEAESMIPPPINLIWLFLIFMGSCIFGLWSAKESWQDYSPLIDTEKNETFSSNNQAHGKSHFSLFQSKTFVEEIEENVANQKKLNFSKNNLTP